MRWKIIHKTMINCVNHPQKPGWLAAIHCFYALRFLIKIKWTTLLSSFSLPIPPATSISIHTSILNYLWPLTNFFPFFFSLFLCFDVFRPDSSALLYINRKEREMIKNLLFIPGGDASLPIFCERVSSVMLLVDAFSFSLYSDKHIDIY